MRVPELDVGQPQVWRFRSRSDLSTWSTGKSATLRRDGADVVLTTAGEAAYVESADSATARALETADIGASLLWLSGVAVRGGQTELTVPALLFAERNRINGPVAVRVDAKVLDGVRDLRMLPRPGLPEADVLLWLAEDWFAQEDEAGTLRLAIAAARPGGSDSRAFRMLGRRTAADLRREPGGGYFVERVTPRRGGRGDRLFLLEAAFELHNDADRIASELDALGAVIERNGSYLELWERYNELERAQNIERARALGFAPYRVAEARGDDTYRFVLGSRAGDFLRAVGEMKQSLEAAPQAPAWLVDPTAEMADERGQRFTFVGNVVRVEGEALILRPTGAALQNRVVPPEAGVLFLSMGGTNTALERRRTALDRIRGGRTELPQLRYLLEEKSVPVERRKKLPYMSAAVRAVFGERIGASGEVLHQARINDRQKEAIEVALNTPDIAIIQGPPGTGKTAVIAAIQAALAEAGETFESVSGSILLSSTQHEAVDNAAERTSVFGLPAVKLGGGRRGDQRRFSVHVDAWRLGKLDEVRADLAALPSGTPLMVARRRVASLGAQYALAPGSSTEASATLVEAATLAAPHVPAGVVARARTLARELKLGRPGVNADVETALRAARALRDEPVSFGDDGPYSAHRALEKARPLGVLVEDEEALLETLAALEEGALPEAFEPVHALKRSLIDRLITAAVPDEGRHHNGDVEEALASITAALEEISAGAAEGIVDVLHDYAHALENDPGAVARAVQSYTSVYAATCQQADGMAMRSAKGLGKEGTVDFPNVVVDEAARSNPLDLLIPMSMASRRVILVGDQRQLPHMLEPSVEQAFDETRLEDELQRALRESLFERLYNHALALQADPKAPRRCVRLNTQYRMHRRLGTFVGDTFYSDQGGLASVRPDEDFEHGLTGFEGRVAAWLDVPLAQGVERSGQSKSRPAEAKAVAGMLKTLVDQDPSLTFGLITFYAAQVEELWRALVAVGLAERDEQGAPHVHPDYRLARTRSGKHEARLHVGTVDAFQGREFDVALLSVVRASVQPAQNEQQRRRKYGHLMMPNRMCVAMSRQRRLLVVAGAAEMATSDEARQHVPALARFHDLCTEDVGLLLSR